MDPIKVDFTSSGKDGSGKDKNKAVVIPPEKKGLKIIINIIVTLIIAAITYYFMLPALNFKAVEIYLYAAIMLVVYSAVNYITSGALRAPEYAPYAKKSSRVPTIIIIVLIAAIIIGFIISSVFFRAKSYSDIIDVSSSKFTETVEDSSDNSFSEVPRMDSETAEVMAERALSDLSSKGYVSQFTVQAASCNQINYKNVPYRVATLQYSNIIKWLTKSSERIPAYITINTITQESKLVMVDGGIQYSTADHFGHYLMRVLRFKYPTKMFSDPTFEIDESGNPYWIVPEINKTIGIFGGTDVEAAIVVDAKTGECTRYSLDTIKSDKTLSWIDRVYPADMLIEQYNYYGEYQKGFWNSILGQKDTYSTTEGYSYLAMNNDVYLYTGVTSLTNDESLTGFTLINMRTKEAKYYTLSGAKESSAQTSAEGLVQQYEYKASFPLLLNIDGEPTYFMSLKDSSGLVKMYAFINVAQYSIGATGSTLTECIDNYIDVLGKNNIAIDVSTDDIVDDDSSSGNKTGDNTTTQATAKTVTGKITDIRTAVISGESYYYFKLDSSKCYYSIAASAAQDAIIVNSGDTVTFTVTTDTGSIIPATKMAVK